MVPHSPWHWRIWCVCFPDNSSLLSPPCLSHTARFDCFVFQLLNVSENAHTRSHPHAHTHTNVYVCTHYMTNADWGQLYSPVVAHRAWSRSVISVRLPGCSIYWGHQRNDATYVLDGEANNTIYTNLARGGGNFQLMGNFLFSFPSLVLTATFQNGHPSAGLMRLLFTC